MFNAVIGASSRKVFVYELIRGSLSMGSTFRRYKVTMIHPAQTAAVLLSSLMYLVCSPAVFATDHYPVNSTMLLVDRSIPGTDQLRFLDEEELRPEPGDFEILSSILMSSVSGERWATITFKNTSPSQRIFTQDHILATFANGSKARPLHIKQVFEGHQVISLTLNFNVHKFPIVWLNTRSQ